MSLQQIRDPWSFQREGRCLSAEAPKDGAWGASGSMAHSKFLKAATIFLNFIPILICSLFFFFLSYYNLSESYYFGSILWKHPTAATLYATLTSVRSKYLLTSGYLMITLLNLLDSEGLVNMLNIQRHG